MNNDDRFHKVATVVTYAESISGALANLRNGKTGMALESLESSLDLCIVSLSPLTKDAAPRDRETILQTLRHLRDYRRIHPRRSEYDMSRLDQSVVAKGYEMGQNAQKILDELK